MGRKPRKIKSTIINNKKYDFVPKQIILKGLTLEMFDYDQQNREWTISRLGEHIIKEYYLKHPPLGFFKSKD